MKLSQFENEEALEVLDRIMEPVSVIVTDTGFISLVQQGTPRIVIAKEVIKNHKKEVIEILAALNGETPETYRFTLISLLRDAMEVMDDPDLAMVFQSQSPRKEEESSGSALESIVE